MDVGEYMIELTENSIQLLNKQNITKDTIVVIKVDVGNLPKHLSEQHMVNIKNSFSDVLFPAKLIIMPIQNTIEIYEKVSD